MSEAEHISGLKVTADQLAEVIAADARNAFRSVAERIANETPYGFAFYTDDSASGIDVAVNTRQAYEAKCALPRSNAFEAYWYTTEWKYEGGFAEHFIKSSELIESFMPDCEDIQAYDAFRSTVFEAMIASLQQLPVDQLFGPSLPREQAVILIAITDSEDDEGYADRSIKRLNPASVYECYKSGAVPV